MDNSPSDADRINQKFSMIDDKYRKEHLISGQKNKQGKVFLVSRNNKLFAAKVFVTRWDFKTEMRINDMVKNVPGIMAVQYSNMQAKLHNDDGTTTVKPVIIMELAQKGDIFDFYQKIVRHHQLQGKNYLFPMDVCKAMFYQLLERVQSLHQSRIIHRDLKPSNVVIDGNYHIRVVDFGLAVSQDAQITNIKAGSRGFIAPEVQSSQYLGPESDIFSCGVIFFVMCCWRMPFANTTQQMKFATNENVQQCQSLWKAMEKTRKDDQSIEQDIKQLFFLIFRSKEERPTIKEILSSKMMSTRASYEKMRDELHMQYKLIENSDHFAKKIAGLRAQFAAELESANEQQNFIVLQNVGTRSAGSTEHYTQFYEEMKQFESREIRPKKLDIDFEDGSWFSCTPAAAMAWISIYMFKVADNKELVLFSLLDEDYEMASHEFQVTGSSVVLDLALVQKHGDQSVFVRLQGQLVENSSGGKFRIEWEKKQGMDLLISALLVDLKQCTAALIVQPAAQKLKHKEHVVQIACQ